jgi:uncharacterized membrane protein
MISSAHTQLTAVVGTLALGVAEGNKGMCDINNVLENGLSPLIFAVIYTFYCDNVLILLAFSGSDQAKTALFYAMSLTGQSPSQHSERNHKLYLV